MKTAWLFFWYWLSGQTRRLGGLRAARSRRLNAEAKKKYGAASVTSNAEPSELSVRALGGEANSGGAR